MEMTCTYDFRYPRIKRTRPTSSQKLHIAYKNKWHCILCDMVLPPGFHIDHHVPLHLGGSNDIHNLVALCGTCHANKTQLENMMRHTVIKEGMLHESRYFMKMESSYLNTPPIPQSCYSYFIRNKLPLAKNLVP